ncbi:hypothetical protein [Spirosoma rhododendri]|uniref:Uncharacterized protein n=1 Tax=Spirosoma rhododendri TaxID=2728024 RepID=A0A7L5DU29_9BACT|nr:hypothetical protein [Spirosoma rhododendri]QJD79070.1 hypothetical protein HH216_12030 [Spirosoma rhododendri]
MEEKPIIVITGYRPKLSIQHVTRLYLNSDEATACRQFEADGGMVATCQQLRRSDIIEWQSTLSGVRYTSDF